MGDRWNAEIRIGGQVPRSVIPGLVEALHRDEASHEYGEAVISKACGSDPRLLYPFLANDVLRFRSHRAENGEFAWTEQFCIEHGIAFDRWGDHYHEANAENVYFRPGMDAPLVLYADSSANEIVDGKTVRAAMKKLDGFKPTDTHGSKSDRVEAVQRLLHDACPPLPTKLEVFNLYGEPT